MPRLPFIRWLWRSRRQAWYREAIMISICRFRHNNPRCHLFHYKNGYSSLVIITKNVVTTILTRKWNVYPIFFLWPPHSAPSYISSKWFQSQRIAILIKWYCQSQYPFRWLHHDKPIMKYLPSSSMPYSNAYHRQYAADISNYYLQHL